MRNPGKGQDPLQIADINPGSSIFRVPSGSFPPKLEGLGLAGKSPGEIAFVKATTQISTPTGSVFVFASVVDRELKPVADAKCDGAYYRMGLRRIGFQPLDAPSVSWIWPSNQSAIDVLLPAASANKTQGFARYNIPNTNRCDWYRYWWKWDTSSYAANRTGPRAFFLKGEDYATTPANYTFTFGPQLLGVTPDLLVAGQYFFTNVAYLGTNRFSELNKPDPAMTQPDRYKLEIVWDDGVTVLPGVMWVSPITSYAAYGLTPVLATHLQANTFSFTLPQTTPPTPADRLKLRVSSLLVPNIAHEVALLPTCPVGPPVIPGPNMALIPAGPFTMGNCMDPGEGDTDELPLHTVYVSAFYMDKYEVTKALWDEVYNWALTHSYSFTYGAAGKAANHPAQSMTWYDAVKWCNARSEKEGRVPAYYTSAAQTAVYRGGQVNVDNNWVKWCTGYRLPTEAEWEKAARGGLSGQRFPWGNTISESQANYYGATGSYSYDLGPNGFNATFATGGYPYTSPVGYFAANANGYGLYDMAGNVWEWCWDWYGWYSSGSQTDPHGPASGSYRVNRGGSWSPDANYCRAAIRYSYVHPPYRDNYVGFRSVLPPGQ